MLIALIAAFVYAASMTARVMCRAETARTTELRFSVPLFVCIACDLATATSVACLSARGEAMGDYIPVISVVALLTAGVIAGRFCITLQDIADGERIIANTISIGFSLLLYVLFVAIAFYSGLDTTMATAPHVGWFIGAIVFLTLVLNTLHDFWDYHEGE